MSTDPTTWQFADGDPALVAHVPTGQGAWQLVRLDQIAPDTRLAREVAAALLRIASDLLDDEGGNHG